MHLESLAIQNYRAFREAEVRLPASGLVLVIGPNNSGKTAFLSALDIIAGSWDGRAPRHAGSSEGITLTARFQLSEEDRAELFRTVDADDAWRESQALRLLEFHFSEPAPGVFIGDGLRTSQDDGQVVDIARVDWVSGQAQGTLFIVPLRDWFKGRHPSAPFEYQNFGVTGVGNTISNLE